MKSRFSTLDIKAALQEIRDNLVGHYILNIYDIDSKTYLLKMRKVASKQILLIESGARVHPTQMEWPKNSAPSGFSMKLRKHLKGKRLTAARQLGFDRIIDLQFGYSGCEDEYHLIIELYDRGNLVLCDQEYSILNLLRQRTDKSTDERFAVREIYPADSAKSLSVPFGCASELFDKIKPPETPVGDKKKKKQKSSIVKSLNFALGYGTDIIENYLIEHGIDPSLPSCDEENSESIIEAMKSCYSYLLNPEVNFSGFITTKTNDKGSEEFVDFQPVKFRQIENEKLLDFEKFSLAVDHFYGQIQMQKSEQKMVQAEKTALKKLENVKLDHLKRLENLKTSQETNVTKAQLIEMNLELVEAALNQVRSALASQIAWEEIEEFLEEAQDEGDPVASAIRELKFKTNQIIVFLAEPNWSDDEDSDSEISENEVENRKACRVTLDLGLSAFGNAKFYYDSKKAAHEKESKTIDASKKALKSAEKKTMESLKNIEVVRQVTKVRKELWFEKFLWFISSENYLVIAGHDAQQNEIIVKRHLRPGDAYVHADIHGASSCVVKNPNKNEPISPVTLHEVGHAAVCHSAAWEAKVMTSAWWVHANQVSKTAPSGEYLTTGSFMIRGKKNYLPPSPLVMGFGFLFKLDDACVANHLGERKIKGQANEEITGKSRNIDDLVEKTENVEISDEKSDQSDDGSAFPNTKIEMNYKADIPDEEVIYMGDDKPLVVKFKQPKNIPDEPERQNKKQRGKPAWQIEKEEKAAEQKKKRGKSAKQKKMREKYADQDDDEREMAMALLGSAGNSGKNSKKFQRKEKKETKSSNRGQKKEKDEKRQNAFQRADEQLPPPSQLSPEEAAKTVEKTESDEEDVEKLLEEEGFMSDVGILDSLTGKPTESDIIHFAVPVVAPLSAVRDYKYHIKMVPGTGKKGKSAKQAISIFTNMKGALKAETDLMKICKDEETTRNFPGKVKLAGQQAQMQKGKKK